LKLNFREMENVVVRLFITKKKLVKKFAEELAYLQIRADWWFYVASGDKEENQSEWIRLLCGDKKGDIISRYVDFTKIYNRQVRIYGRTREAVLSTTDMQG